MAERKIVKEIDMTTGACPTQWEGMTTDGEFIYIRYRHGYFTCGIGETEDDAISRDVLWKEVPRWADGIMDWDEMMVLTEEILDWSQVAVQS
jgi:hypothetical protein